MSGLNSPLKELPRIGEKTGAKLKKLGLEYVSDLLFYFPFRYENFGDNQKINNLNAGDTANVSGIVELIQSKRSFKKKLHITEALINDGYGSIKAIWFNQPFLSKNIKVGDKISLAGKISENYGQLFFSSPDYEKMDSLEKETKNLNTEGLVPVYHSTDKLSQKQLRFFIKTVIHFSKECEEWLPSEIRKNLKLISLENAIEKIHFPKNLKDIETARTRLAFSELFFRQIKSQIIKKRLAEKSANKIKFLEGETKAFVNSLPFKLTNAQKKAAWEILKDINKEKAMSRLLEGDVGSGKTVVVSLALLNTALNGLRSALMVPSEILAKQHFETITRLFEKYDFKTALKTRSFKEGDYKKADIVIGTHALIQEKSELEKISLAVVDEQHRFGIKQRKKIIDLNKDKNINPHFLSLTATPIPRSLSLAIYGDLELSIIDEVPIGRKKIITKTIKEADRQKIYNFIKEEVHKGRQAFFVYPLIEESEKINLKSVKQEFDNLKKSFPKFSIGLIHGKLKKEEKENIMADFSAGKINILLATSVIEVGIDIPKATVMVIEGADRFGLAQLHQLRGRVNRSDLQSYCFLFLSKETISNEKTIKRLEALNKYHDGLSLAKIDLKLRGSGEIFGLSQSGFSEISLASFFDYEFIKKAQEEAKKLIELDPELKKHERLKIELGKIENDFHLE